MSAAIGPEARGEAPGRGRLQGRRIVVVGAGQVDYGIDDQPIGNGRAIAVLCAREGATVVAVDRDRVSAEETAGIIRDEGGAAHAVEADVTDPAAITAMIDQAHGILGAIDGLAYNVGVGGPRSWAEVTPEAWDATLAVNLRGAVLTAQAAMPVLEPDAAMVFTSSIAAIRGNGSLVAYEASKAGLGTVMRCAAIEGAPRGIRANIVMPGLIATGMGGRSDRADPSRADLKVPLGRKGTAWEVAYGALFLLSGESSYTTGHTLVVDGGRATL